MLKKVAIVSLSAGTIGESFVKHEVDLGIKRLEQMGLEIKFMPHALLGIDYVKNHPQQRAQDLLDAFSDPSVDFILCAIGGDDTYRLLPYLFGNGELKKVISNKVFLGFSDSTINHLMLYKAGLNTFYGQSFLADICELDKTMLSYSEHYLRELISTGTISRITPSPLWYENRTDWSVDALGTSRVVHKNGGYELLQGPAVFSGKILGGCIDSIYDIFDNSRYQDSVSLCAEYELFPSSDDWRDKILLLETSEEKASPQLYTKMLTKLKEAGVFDVISGIIMGRPIDEEYSASYKKIITEVVDNPSLPIVSNISIGHATPRCIIPFGVEATVDTIKQEIVFK